jgi:hypothetical protein
MVKHIQMTENQQAAHGQDHLRLAFSSLLGGVTCGSGFGLGASNLPYSVNGLSEMTPTPSATRTLLWLLVRPPVLLLPAAPDAPARAFASASLALLIVDATFSSLPAVEAAGAAPARAARIFISAFALPVAVPTGCCAAAFALAVLDLILVDLEAAADAAADFAAAAGVAEVLRGAAASGLAGRPGALWLLLTLLLLRDPGLLLLLLLLGTFLTTCGKQQRPA